MRKMLKINMIFVVFIVPTLVFAQNPNVKNFTQSDFDNYKVDSNIYNYWHHNDEYSWFSTGDTVPKFVDMNKYKGIINYGVTFELINHKNFNFIENFTMFSMKISINHFKFDISNNTVEIEGVITDTRSGTNWKGVNNHVDVFIGNRKDTISQLLYYDNLVKSSEINVFYKGKKITSPQVLDTFPSFYLLNYSHLRTNSGKEREFKIKSKVDENTIIVFGLSSCFAEIFEIGKLLFSDEKRKKINEKIEKSRDQTIIIRNNLQESEKETVAKLKKPLYYLTTEKAENYILRNQFGKAKEEYNTLLEQGQYIFARDIHNAVRVSILSRDYEKAIIWCEKLVEKGVSLQYFNAKIFNRLKKDQLWSEFLKKYPRLYQKHKEGLNQKLVFQLSELVNLDQSVYIKNTRGEIEKSELRKTTNLIDDKFIKLIQKEGFPTEERIGVRLSEDGTIIQNPIYYILIYHSHQINSSRLPEIKKIRDKATTNFEHDGLRDKLEIFKKSGNTCLQIYKGNLYNNKTCNLNEMQVKKISFRFENQYNFIIDEGEYIVIPYEYENENENDTFFKEEFDFIKKLTDDWFFYEK